MAGVLSVSYSKVIKPNNVLFRLLEQLDQSYNLWVILYPNRTKGLIDVALNVKGKLNS